MSDLTERLKDAAHIASGWAAQGKWALRNSEKELGPVAKVCADAARRIEALEAEVARLREALGEDEPPTPEEVRSAREAFEKALASADVCRSVLRHNAILRHLLANANPPAPSPEPGPRSEGEKL